MDEKKFVKDSFAITQDPKEFRSNFVNASNYVADDMPIFEFELSGQNLEYYITLHPEI